MIDFKNGSVFKLKKVDDAKFNDELAPLLVAGEVILGRVTFEFRGSSDIIRIGRLIAQYALR